MAGKPKKRPEKSQPRYLDPDSWIYAESSPRVRVAGGADSAEYWGWARLDRGIDAEWWPDA
jgi:hypothetical protein